MNLTTDDREAVREVFEIPCRAALVTKEEDRKLNGAKLRNAMPSNRSFGGDILARYSAVGIELLSPSLSDQAFSRCLNAG